MESDDRDEGHAENRASVNPAKDPVCGMDVMPDGGKGTFVYEGKTYHFCSVHCLDKFRADPGKYTHPVPLPQKEEQPAQYTCPMHPDIVSEKRGACPKCGMNLEPLSPQLAASPGKYTCPMHPEIVRDGPGDCPICGMDLEPQTATGEEEESPELKAMARRFRVSLALSLPVHALAMSEMIPGRPVERLVSLQIVYWIEFILATSVVLWGGSIFFKRAWGGSSRRAG
jgi:P-type Cu+ transporter